METLQNNKRIHSLDTIRGVIIIGVVIYHFIFDLIVIYGIDFPIFFSWWINAIRDLGAGMLIFISGISSYLSRSNLKRGIKALAVAAVFSLATWFFVRDEFIFAGILHFLGLCMVISHFTIKYIKKIPVVLGIVVCTLGFILTYNIYYGSIEFFNIWSVELNASWCNNLGTYLLGINWDGIHSADYFPILPWIFVFVAGNIMGRYFKAGRIPKIMYKDFCPVISYIGTKTLLIYVIHQPVLYGIMELIYSVGHNM